MNIAKRIFGWFRSRRRCCRCSCCWCQLSHAFVCAYGSLFLAFNNQISSEKRINHLKCMQSKICVYMSHWVVICSASFFFAFVDELSKIRPKKIYYSTNPHLKRMFFTCKFSFVNCTLFYLICSMLYRWCDGRIDGRPSLMKLAW